MADRPTTGAAAAGAGVAAPPVAVGGGVAGAPAPLLPVSIAPPAPAPVVTGQPWRPILPPEITRKIKKWQMINFAGTLAQLTFSIAIIGIISNQLQIVRATPLGPNSGKWSYACLLATSEHPQTCQYAYSVASVSIFAGFIVSMFQCLTLDCCGMGRLVEAMFDALACFWWVAGASTVTTRAEEATREGVAGQGWREAVVALSWAAAASFLALFVTNIMLTNKLGKAFKEVRAQQAAAMAAAGAGAPGAYAVQMTAPSGYPPGAAYAPAGAPPSGYPPAAGGAPITTATIDAPRPPA